MRRRRGQSLAVEKGEGMTKNLSGASVLFDLDGTLIDTADDLAASMNHALAGDGLAPVSPQEVRHLVGYGARRMLMRGYELSAGQETSEPQLDAALERFLDHYKANIAIHSRPFEGVIDLIKALRSDGAAIAICTNKREAMAVRLLETLGFRELFDTVVGADTTIASKPDPAPVLLCLARTKADRGIFIGDSDTDIRAAEAANLPCIVADFGYGPLTLEDRCAMTFNRYAEIEEFIRRTLARP